MTGPTEEQIAAGKAACRTILTAVLEHVLEAHEREELAGALARAVLEGAAKVSPPSTPIPGTAGTTEPPPC